MNNIEKREGKYFCKKCGNEIDEIIYFTDAEIFYKVGIQGWQGEYYLTYEIDEAHEGKGYFVCPNCSEDLELNEDEVIQILKELEKHETE